MTDPQNHKQGYKIRRERNAKKVVCVDYVFRIIAVLKVMRCLVLMLKVSHYCSLEYALAESNSHIDFLFRKAFVKECTNPGTQRHLCAASSQ